MITPETNWGKIGLGRYLPSAKKKHKVTPKALSTRNRRKRSSNTVKRKVATSVPVSVVANPEIRSMKIDDEFENDPAMVKKYEKTILVENANSNKPSGRKRLSPKGDK